ncbi:LacI family DNA-binding transcriptional regulator [Gordonia sp. N1V]|uniref:LacI family DNA-binding transcriptional regulator n=1 Tax=Gordonia sp. N1V TaxID=3034163 RepID=UPI0023E0F468|nr:LacI family DNA-binding transcriptional regulator [Gordonia sp. N1V]MDF3284541.1 LacI family DNA-binding transcriptional regulator [Gordonia sp. N1V]
MASGWSVNMADVARHLGVSTATVSRALRGEPGVSAETRDRIRKVADELGYVVSPEASGLARGATGRVGIVLPRLDLWFYGCLVAGIEESLRSAGLDCLIYCLDSADQRRSFAADLPLRRKVDAVIAVAFPSSDIAWNRLDDMHIPVVTVATRVDRHPYVGIDDELVGRQAARHLVRLGHRRIGMIRGLDPDGIHWQSDDDRARGFLDELASAGVEDPARFIVSETSGIDGGALAMEFLLGASELPTAIFCTSDEPAIGVQRVLRRAGIRVPQSISLIGVDDQPIAEAADLTTIAQPVIEQGRTAGRLTADLISGATAVPMRTLLPTRLVVRGSAVSPPPVDGLRVTAPHTP